MKKVLIAVLFFIFIFSGSAYADSGYYIKSYVVDINVKENAVYEITETIDVHFTEQSHGIIRTIPVHYTSQRAKINDIDVNTRHIVLKEPTAYSIRLGAPDKMFFGDYRYVISYKYDIGDDNIADYDQFYFNIIGNDWNTSILNVTFNVEFPKEFNKNLVWLNKGFHMDNIQSNVHYDISGNVIFGQTSGLRPYEGLTLRVELPQGYFINARENIDLSRYFSYASWIICIVLGISALAAWFVWGKDEKLYPVVLFKPQEGMTPADMGYIGDGMVDDKDLMSLVYYWADKGYLTVEEMENNGYKFIKSKNIENPKEYEKFMFDKFFGSGNGQYVTTKDLEKSFYVHIPTIKQMIRKEYSGEKKVITPLSKKLSVVFMVLGVVPSVLYTLTMYANIMAVHVFIPILAGLLLSAILGLVVIYTIKKWFLYSVFAKLSRAILITFITLILGFICFGYGSYMGNSYYFGMWSIGFVIAQALRTVIFSLLLFIIAGIMEKRSPYGQKQLESILGLRDFMEKTEIDRLKKHNDENPSYYYNVLPYAIVLGLENKWAEKFKNLVLEPPTWYKGSYAEPFTTVLFLNSLNKVSVYTVTAMSMQRSSRGVRAWKYEL